MGAFPNTSQNAGYLTPVQEVLVDDAIIENIFINLVLGVTGLPNGMVRRAYPPPPLVVPASPDANINWAALFVASLEPLSARAQVRHNPGTGGNTGYDELLYFENGQVRVSFYGPNAMGFANRFKRGLMIEQNRASLRLNNIGLTSVEGVLAVHAISSDTNNVVQRRFDLTLYFQRGVSEIFQVRNIIEAAGQIQMQQGPAKPGVLAIQTFDTPVVPGS